MPYKKSNEVFRSTKQGDPYVYFIQIEPGPIKIGWTTSYYRRWECMETYQPYQMRLLWIEPGGKVQESVWHDRFQDAHIRAEWFHPTDFVLSTLADRLFDAPRDEFQQTKFGNLIDRPPMENTIYQARPWWLPYRPSRFAPRSARM